MPTPTAAFDDFGLRETTQWASDLGRSCAALSPQRLPSPPRWGQLEGGASRGAAAAAAVEAALCLGRPESAAVQLSQGRDKSRGDGSGIGSNSSLLPTPRRVRSREYDRMLATNQRMQEELGRWQEMAVVRHDQQLSPFPGPLSPAPLPEAYYSRAKKSDEKN